jgi:enamine deaminase RidA (YjgF/YER057c/UK114 family)
MAELVQPPGWPTPSVCAYGVIAPGRLLAISGQVGTDRDGQIVSRDFAQQFDRALENVLTVVETAGGRATDVVSLTVYLVDRLQFLASTAEVGLAWQRHAGAHRPAMAVVEVKGLLTPGTVVELQALAVLPVARPPAGGGETK